MNIEQADHDDDAKRLLDLVVTHAGAVYHVDGCCQIRGREVSAYVPGMQRTLSDGTLVTFRPCSTCRPGNPESTTTTKAEPPRGWTPSDADFERLMWRMLGAEAAP
jgi:hypothetical protein